MSKKRFVLSITPDVDGPTFGRIDDPVNIQKAQDYAHAHIEQITKDLLMADANSAAVAGFLAPATGGLNLTVQKGAIVDPDGVAYTSPSDAAVVKTMIAADVANPRIDLIYATLEIDAPAESEFVSFRQLRTQAELEAG